MPETGLEPVRLITRPRILSPLRLPFHHSGDPPRQLYYFTESAVKSSGYEIPPGVMKAAAYLDKHYRKDIYLDDLAEIAAMSKNSLLRNFRRIMHCSPMEYLLQRRLAQVCRQLTGTSLLVKEIASECGFTDLAYFTRIFKRKMGCTPGDYRQVRKTGSSPVRE